MFSSDLSKSSSNEHKKFKKNQNVKILAHIAVICDMVMRKKYKLGVGHFHEKKLHTNELSRMKLFRVRRIEKEGLGFEKIQKNRKKIKKITKV